MKKLNKNIYDLDPERLATTDEHGNRVYLYPEDFKGRWKNRRFTIYWALIILYLILPWFYIDNKPAIMVNIFKREFTFFGNTMHGVEPVLFFLLLASAIFFIAFSTSLLGRVWCGWACPQTVFIHTIFSKIETLIEGHSRKRRQLDQAPLSLEKIYKKSLKWIIFTLLSLHIAHTFMGYFIGPRELFQITLSGPHEHFGIFMAIMIFTSIILLDFGWFREQFCIIACPYGRIQSVIMDENSLVVAYDAQRGEPRRGATSTAASLSSTHSEVQNSAITTTTEGDCVNCYNCVKACPTGIDIRRGTQMECIACTQCIDACDNIMDRLAKPRGLIKYSSALQLAGGKKKWITIRSLIYISISIILISSFVYFLNATTHLRLVFLRAKTPFSVIETPTEKLILNQFTLQMIHQGTHDFDVDFRISDPELFSQVSIVTPVRPVKFSTNEKKIVIFFKFSPKILIAGSRKVSFEVFDVNTKHVDAKGEVLLVGPNF